MSDVGERELVLVRHSLPEIEPGRPAPTWRLNEVGRERCSPLAEALRPYEPAVVVTSEEPKAVETGHLVAEGLGVPWESFPGLHEHERRDVPFTTPEAFRGAVARLFESPDELVFGGETANEAHARYAAAVRAVMARHAEGNVALVSHGTVMTLYISRATGIAAYAFWRRLALPAFAVLRWSDEERAPTRLLHVTFRLPG
jgi:broad specificity phosphatase PhoE